MHVIPETTWQSELVTALTSLNKDEKATEREPLDKQNTWKTANAFIGDIHGPKPAAFSEGIK